MVAQNPTRHGNNFQDLTGKQFGRLTVISEAGMDGKHVQWLCRCSCGETKLTITGSLNRGCTRSCGCLLRETHRAPEYRASLSRIKTVHGEIRREADGAKRRSAEYIAWGAMKTRCSNRRHKTWKDYGGRGIRVCARWSRSFPAFLADMGRKPSTLHSMDRINNEGNYKPGNCRWATKKDQANNRRPRRRKHS